MGAWSAVNNWTSSNESLLLFIFQFRIHTHKNGTKSSFQFQIHGTKWSSFHHLSHTSKIATLFTISDLYVPSSWELRYITVVWPCKAIHQTEVQGSTTIFDPKQASTASETLRKIHPFPILSTNLATFSLWITFHLGFPTANCKKHRPTFIYKPNSNGKFSKLRLQLASLVCLVRPISYALLLEPGFLKCQYSSHLL